MSEAAETEEGRRHRMPRATLEHRVLATLKAAGKPLTDADLAARLRVSLQSVAQASQDLAEVGRVKRLTEPLRGKSRTQVKGKKG